MYFIGNDGYHNLSVFVPMLSYVILERNRKVTKWISTGISPEKIKSLANGRVNLKFNNSVLMQEFFSSLYSNSILKFIHSL